MTDVHRKIELQEQGDLRYLINNAQRRANEMIDCALPPIEGEDSLRRRVEELVHEVSLPRNHSFPLDHVQLLLILKDTLKAPQTHRTFTVYFNYLHLCIRKYNHKRP